ncbi:hypothetical protein ACH4XT_14880 [Streptomyces avidinii]|uniref:hypothetical protein n=1 Tax=Streptomyces avidinii TaxID=1895 RepID=UPI0037BAFF4C
MSTQVAPCLPPNAHRRAFGRPAKSGPSRHGLAAGVPHPRLCGTRQERRLSAGKGSCTVSRTSVSPIGRIYETQLYRVAAQSGGLRLLRAKSQI